MTVRLTWELPATADAVEVYRSESTINPASPGDPYDTLSGSALLYDDTATVSFTRYYYRVAVRLTGPSPDGFAISDEVVVDIYDTSNTDANFEDVAILYRYAEDPWVTALPLNEGYIAFDPEHRNSPPRAYHTPQVRNHYQTSLISPAANPGSFWVTAASPEPSVDIGIADSFGSLTMDGWLYRANGADQSTLFASRSSGGDSGFEFRVDTLEALKLEIWDGAGTPAKVLTLASANAAVPNDEWVHIAGVRTGTRDWELFVNGISVATGSQTAAGADDNRVTTNGMAGFVANGGTYWEAIRWTTGVARWNATFTPEPFFTDVLSPVPVPFSAVRGTPFLVAAGTRNANNGAASAPFPSSYQEFDLLILQIRSDASGGVPSPPAGGDWLLIDSIVSGAGSYPQIRHTLYYKFAGPSEDTSPIVPDAAGTIHVRISVWRNVASVNSPIAGIVTSGDATLDLAYDADGITTLIDGSAVLHFMVASDNTALIDVENTDLFDYQEAYFDANTTGSDGSHQCVWGIKKTAGAVGNFTGTKSLSGTDAHIVIELRGDLSTETPLDVSGAAALAVPSISLGGIGVTGSWEMEAALTAPATVLAGTGTVTP